MAWSDDEAKEFLRAVKNIAKDHAMSFVHTPGKFSENDNIDDSKPFHNLNPSDVGEPGTSAEPSILELHSDTLEDLRGKVVTPTSNIMTLAYWLKGLHGTREGGRFRNSTFDSTELTDEQVNAITDDNHPRYTEMNSLLGVGPVIVKELSQINKIVKFSDDNQDDYRLENRRQFVETNAQSVWIPGIGGKLTLPNRLKQNKKLEERLNLLKPLKPLDRNIKSGQELKINPITPLTEYYLMRYMGPWLLENYVEEAMPYSVEGSKGKRSVLKRIRIDTKQKSEELDDDIVDLVNELALEKGSPIDEMFAFERIRTVYRYPENYPQGYVTEDGTIQQPDPRNDDIRVDYGILQQIYASLAPSGRKNFVKQTKKFVLDTMPKKQIKRRNTGPRGSNALPNATQSNYYPVGAGNDLSHAEATIVWLEESADQRAFQNEHQLKLPIDISKPLQKEQISEGAKITVPGLILLLAEKSGEHALYDSISNAETLHIGNYDRLEKYDYLIGLMEMTQKPGLVKDTELDESVAIQEDALKEILISEYEGVYQPLNQSTCLFVHSDETGVVTTLTLNPSVLQKAVVWSELESKLETALQEDFVEVILGSDLGNLSPNAVVKKEAEEEPALVAYAQETGLQIRAPRKFGAKAFNALGYLVEDQMIRSAQRAARTTQIAKTSTFDKMVAALVGSVKHPGLAVSHATLHFQKLLVQMKSPVKNWDIVSTDDFEEGRFLSLTSFLDSPTEKALYWMLNETGFISVGNFTGDRPTFFEIPKPAAQTTAMFTGLMNSFATVVIGYYRILFSQIRQRMVFIRSGKEGAKATPETIDLNRYWKSLMKDANTKSVDPAIYGAILRFFSQSETGAKPILRIPTWMPLMPDDLRAAQQTKSDPKMTLNYLKWAYGADPMSLEVFAENAAAYHAAKALTGHTDYPHMVQRFVQAVIEDRGAPFLFAILLRDNFDQSPETQSRTATPNIMGVQTPPGPEAAAPPKNDGLQILAEIIEKMSKGVIPDGDESSKLQGLELLLTNKVDQAIGSLQNLDPNNIEENIESSYDLLRGVSAFLPENMREKWVEKVDINAAIAVNAGLEEAIENLENLKTVAEIMDSTVGEEE